MKHTSGITGGGMSSIGLPLILGLIALVTAFVSSACESPSGGGGGTTYSANYTVTFNGNGDGVTGLPAAITGAASGTKITRPSPDPARTGYTFGGWYKEAAATTAWDFATDTVTADITLYAKWTAASYTIIYNLDGGTGAVNTTYTIESSAITLPTPTKVNYDFGGWFDNAQCNGSAITAIAAGSSGDKTFWAKWTPSTKQGAIAAYWLNEQGHIAFTGGATASVTNAAGQSVVITASGEGYTDQHWYLKGAEDIARMGLASYTFNAAGKDAGEYKIGLRVTRDGQQYYAEFTVTVTNGTQE